MKIQCDVCSKEEASVFCCADEAALCASCDRRVHRANKLAGKHRRLSLILPSSAHHSPPVCDICQEKQGLIFCQEDRAILCKDCDEPIHNVSHLTKKHNRFLLTGARLSAAPAPSSTDPEEPKRTTTTAADAGALKKKRCSSEDESVATTTSTPTSNYNSSSISEYLMETLPGWQVEDLLIDDAATAAATSSKTNELLPFLESDLDGAAADDLTFWVPDVPHIIAHQCQPAPSGGGGGAAAPVWQQKRALGAKETSPPRWGDDAFTVPQMYTAPSNSKRLRPSMWFV